VRRGLLEIVAPRGTRRRLALSTVARRLRAILVGTPPASRPPARPRLAEQYAAWIQSNDPRPDDLDEIRRRVPALARHPLVSVIMPVFDPEDRWLRRAVESLLAQAYPRWELCVVDDGSTAPHVAATLSQLAARDARIRARRSDRNMGIAAASNAALAMASGEYVAFLDHDDELAPHALYEVVQAIASTDPPPDIVYSDEDKLEPEGRRVEPFFKPDWSPDLLMSCNYVNHLLVVRRSLIEEVGGFRQGFDGSQDHDPLLRLVERTTRIVHVPDVLYHWRKVPESAASSALAKPHASEAGRRAVEEAVLRRWGAGTAEILSPGRYRARYAIRAAPLVSIVIPTRDRPDLLARCLRSIRERTAYSRIEIVVVDNGSTDPETTRLLERVGRRERVVRMPGPFNWSRLSNAGASAATGDLLLFLNDDVEAIEPGWLEAMVEHAQRDEVGAVGARLLFPDGRIQHAGVLIGVGGVATHAFLGLPADQPTYVRLAEVVRNCSAVTGACLMTSGEAFRSVGGFDERFRVAFGDVDYCLRLRERDRLVVYTPHATLLHRESSTRGRLYPLADERLFRERHGALIARGDPYYNVNFSVVATDFSLRVL
jgi:GT2 family glycosyltransferase